MEKIRLTDTQSRAHFFQRGLLIGLQYWQTWLGDNLADLAALDRERSGIVRAIAFALDLEEQAWSTARDLIVAFSPYMERRGYWDVWGGVLSRAIKVARQSGDTAGVANLSAILARLLYQQSRFAESTAAYRRAIRLSRQIGDKFGEARACTNLGYFYIEQGQWYRGEVLCCHALSLFEQVNSDHGRAHTENHLGILCMRQNRWGQARQHYERACALWQAMGDQHGFMRGLMNLGGLHIYTKEPEAALSYLKKALEQARLTGEELTVGTIYMNMGFAYKLRGALDQAEAYSRRAEAIFRRFSNLRGLADVRENLGLIYLEGRKWSAANAHLKGALETWRAINNKPGEIRSMIHLVETELARGNHQGAGHWLKVATQQLTQHDQTGRYEQLHQRLEKFRRSLT